jgi:hypothetical protein
MNSEAMWLIAIALCMIAAAQCGRLGYGAPTMECRCVCE